MSNPFDAFRNAPTAGRPGMAPGQSMYTDGRPQVDYQPAPGQQGSTGQPYAMGQPQQAPYAPGQGGFGAPAGMPSNPGYPPPQFASQGGQMTPDQWNQQMNAKAAQYGQPMQGASGGGQQQPMSTGGQPQQSPYALGGQPASQSSGNPYLQNQQNAISSQVTNTLNRQIMPGINRGAIAAGGYGGSRQGIAQGLAINGATDSIANATANMQGNAYEQDANRSNQASMQAAALANQSQIASMQDATQRYGLGNQYSLGMGNLGLGFQNSNNAYDLGMRNQATNQYQADTTRQLGFGQLDNAATSNAQNFYTAQRGQDLTASRDGFNMFRDSLGMGMGVGNDLYNTGKNEADAGNDQFSRYADVIRNFGGFGGGTSTTGPGGGGGFAGAAGGALTMAQLLQLLGGKRD